MTLDIAMIAVLLLLPLVRFQARGRYDARDIHARLAPYLTTPEQGSVACQNATSSTP